MNVKINQKENTGMLKKIIFSFAVIPLMVYSFVFAVNAEFTENAEYENESYTDGVYIQEDAVSEISEFIVDEEYRDFGQDDIMNALPDDIRNEFQQQDITPDNSGALSFSVIDIIGNLWNSLLTEINRPLKLLASLAGIILLNAVVEALRDSTGSSQAVKVFGIVSVLAGAGMICAYISDCVVRACQTLEAGGTFLATFVPVFAGIMAICGQLTTAPVFSSVIIVAAQLFTHFMVMALMPLSSGILGISAACAINPDLKIERFAETVKKIVVWALGLLITIFVGLLSIQSFITNSADTVAMKAAKFAVSNSVPIVGGAVSDALATVKGSLGLLRSSTGTFGIIAGVSIIFPALLSVACYKFALGIAAALSDLFGIPQLTSLLKSGESVLSIILAMLFCFLLLAVISIALMLMIGSGNMS